MNQPERLHAIVSGTVQGVNFRYTTLDRAKRLGLTGWVRNVNDGSVEVTAEGPRPALDQLLTFLHQGPLSAAVKEVHEDWLAATGEFKDFNVRW